MHDAVRMQMKDAEARLIKDLFNKSFRKFVLLVKLYRPLIHVLASNIFHGHLDFIFKFYHFIETNDIWVRILNEILHDINFLELYFRNQSILEIYKYFFNSNFFIIS